ncbi:PREDICTED: uncharacterized protein LOC106104496 isoform X2 [Papilio polytes]|uniref:uncharacterized protein LOC106104496 isoform X2 n=1 Tax=Papilio polytes TaxID=76194 RepID=UPI000675C232|nr:PREDICTED: uncharacterized protein LOC106104496 isoform X2 [Papilio polytes]
MDHVKFSVLREKWRRYFEDGQRDVFDTSSSEESDDKHHNPKHNKLYMELFRMLPTIEPNDLNTDCLDIPVGPLSDEIGVTTAVTSGMVDLPAAEHKKEHSDFEKLQFHEMAGDGTTVKCGQQYECFTYAHELESMLEQSESELAITSDESQFEVYNDTESASSEFAQGYEHNTVYNMELLLEQSDSNLAINADISQLQDHHDEESASDESIQKHEDNKVHEMESVEAGPQIPQVRDHPRVNVAEANCFGDLLRPEYEVQQELRLAQLDCMTDQPSEFPSGNGRQQDLLKSNGKLLKMEDIAGPSTSVVENNHRSKFAQKVEQMFRETQSNCEEPRIKPVGNTLSQWKPYLILPFMYRNAQYKRSLQPILEESADTIQELVSTEMEQLHHLPQKSDLETHEEEPHLEQETESDDLYDEDYEDSLSMDEDLLLIEAPLIFIAGEQFEYLNTRRLILNGLFCIAIYLGTVEDERDLQPDTDMQPVLDALEDPQPIPSEEDMEME